MESRLTKVIILAGVFAVAAAVLICAGNALAQGPGQPIVELHNYYPGDITSAVEFPSQKISGTDNVTRQAYKFQRQRQGKSFGYVVANLRPSTTYRVELSFVEHDRSASRTRIFNVYFNGTKVLSKLDLYARVGKNRAVQNTGWAKTGSNGLLSMRFRSDEPGCRGYATVSTVRLYIGTKNAVVINAAASRLNMHTPTRFTNAKGQDSYETVLGRLGSRLCLNLLPQKLSSRFSSLGDGTGDVADLVLGLINGSSIRCLPFTDRYPVWEKMSLSQTMTSQTYKCSSGTVPFEVTVTFRAPFYPRQEKISGAPFFYVDVTVKNIGSVAATPSFIFARAHKESWGSAGIAEFTDATKTGYKNTTVYNYYDETQNGGAGKRATEALAVPTSEASNVDFRGTVESEYTDFKKDRLWGNVSPGGFPRTYSDYMNPIYSFYPRGYTGAVWSVGSLAPGGSSKKHFVMAGYISDKILRVKNKSYDDSTFVFKYTKQLGSVGQVIDYAFSNRSAGDAAETKSKFFDSTVSSNNYLQLPSKYSGSVKNLIANSFQSYLMNTWWATSSSSREWFSVWEGSSCRFHSTVDVEYNNAWFYFDFWPDLLKKIMNEWLLYAKSSPLGTYLSHDMGFGDQVVGQAYPHNMAVEENTNFILLLYKYWKTTGDIGYVRQKFGMVKKLVDFLIRCDTNNNGVPDRNIANTVDQGSLAIQNGKDQAYLGTKCLAAYQAAREMAASLGNRDYRTKCEAQVESINQTLEYDMWLSDHYAVCIDDDVLAADREAYSIYPSNGLLYLLTGTRAAGLTSNNTDRMRTDLVNSTSKTLKTYGSTHSSYDTYNEWVSQNLWRDQVACLLGTSLNGDNPLALSRRYWNLEQYYAKKLWGAFWDVAIYPGGSAGGASTGLTPTTGAMSGAAKRRSAVDGEGGSVRSGSGSSIPGAPAQSLQQSLGYYPRGAASLGLLDGVAGITLDATRGALYYKQTTHPLRVPVFSRAAWGNADPAKRVPTLYFSSASGSPVIKNRSLLPAKVAPTNMTDLTGVSAGSHALSPNGDSVNESTTVKYNLPRAARVTASIWDGSMLKKSFTPSNQGSGQKSFTWDGRTDDGAVVDDGLYTARIEARSTNSSYEIRPGGTPVYVNNTIPDLSTTWYLAEGFTGTNATGGHFETYILIQNPSTQQANVKVTFMLRSGATRDYKYVIPAASRFTITVNNLLPDAEVSTVVQSDRPVAVERAMYFNNRKAGHDSIGVSRPSKTWYLAEGYTAQSFDEYVLIQNPGNNDAQVTATFMTASTGNKIVKYDVAAHSRFTIKVDDIVPADSVSTQIKSTEPVVAERAQYLNNMTAGTCSIGAVSMSRTWYLAEGYTDQGFEEWVLIQNPQPTPNNVTVTFMDKNGANTIKQYELAPQSRFTILVDSYLPASEVSTKVRSQDPVIVERAMYWNNRSDGHDCIGTPTPDSEWYLAEGYTAQGFETWVLVQNPGDETRNVVMTFMEPGGRNTVKNYQVAPRSRFTVGVDSILPASEVSTRVSADGPIIVERAIYFNNRSGGTASIGIRGY